MRIARTLLTTVVWTCAAQAASASCYYVYGSSNQLLYRSAQPPVDLALQLHETVPTLGSGLSLVFTPNGAGCEGTLDMLQNHRNAQAKLAQRAAQGPRRTR